MWTGKILESRLEGEIFVGCNREFTYSGPKGYDGVVSTNIVHSSSSNSVEIPLRPDPYLSTYYASRTRARSGDDHTCHKGTTKKPTEQPTDAQEPQTEPTASNTTSSILLQMQVIHTPPWQSIPPPSPPTPTHPSKHHRAANNHRKRL